MNIIAEMENFFKYGYCQDSLAYLGLTTKIEGPFRDQFAYYLHKKYTDCVISREFTDKKLKRVDLAILNNNLKIHSLIEFKACYSFDLINPKYTDAMVSIEKDYYKHQSLGFLSDTYFILLSTRVDQLPHIKYVKAVKYYKGMNRFGKINSNTQYTKSVIRIKKWLTAHPLGLHCIDDKTFKIGTAFGVDVYLDYFIIKA